VKLVEKKVLWNLEFHQALSPLRIWLFDKTHLLTTPVECSNLSLAWGIKTSKFCRAPKGVAWDRTAWPKP
jgi:hypothetical protein